jgi:branched-chain amino acid transport system ATP-binding protein
MNTFANAATLPTEKSSFSLELKDVRKSFGKSDIIRGTSLQVPTGGRYAVIGPNGAGKSTLFNLISGRFGASSGDILLNGASTVGLQPYQINRLGLSRSFQITNIFHRLSVFENLRCAVLWSLGYKYSFWHRLGGLKDARERVEAVLEQIGLTRRSGTAAGLLTYAEQRALEIGITIAGGSEVILLDEPTAGMSRSESDAAVELIRKVTVGKTLLMVEHDMSVVFGLADKIAVLVYGEIIACDTPANIRNNAEVQEAYLGTSMGTAKETMA